MEFYDLLAKDINGKDVKMEKYKGKVLLVVNTATKCGLAPQLNELENLYKSYNNLGLEVLGFPCGQFANQESKSNEEISKVCAINYGVTFDMFEKIEVNGKDAHPIYKYLKSQAKGILTNEIKWNFTKFLIDKNGNVVRRYAPTTKPLQIKNDIEELLI